MKRKIKRVLVIRFRRVGDAVISTVICSTLKRTFPDAQIDYVLNEGIAPLFEHHPDINRLITFCENDMSGFGRYVKKVRNIVRDGNYDIIVDTRATVKTLWFSLFSLSTPYRLGRKKGYNCLLHNLRSDDHFENTDDEVIRTLRLLKPLEKYYPLKYVHDFKLYVTNEEKSAYHQYMINQGVSFDKPVIVCAVTTRVESKCWKKEYMQSILQKMIDQYDAQLIFNYAGDEKEYAENLFHQMNDHPNIFIHVEAKGLRQLSALMTQAGFFFGNEGGPRHISQAFEVPSFAIFSPSISKSVWLPNKNEHYQGIQFSDIYHSSETNDQLSDRQKFDMITDEVVWKRLEPMLNIFLAKS